MTYALILVNFAVFIAEASGWPVLIDLFALWPPARSGAPATPDFHVWQLLTYSVLHASLAHVAFNMFGLYMFGRDVERVLGRARFLALYLASVLAGAIAQLGVMRALPPADAPTVGASAGVFGALIAYAVLFPRRRVVLLFPPVHARLALRGRLCTDRIAVRPQRRHERRRAFRPPRGDARRARVPRLLAKTRGHACVTPVPADGGSEP